MKVVYNACFGGFSLSSKAIERYAELAGMTLYPEPSSFHRGEGDLENCTLWKVPPDQRKPRLRQEDWYKASQEEREAANNFYSQNTFYPRDLERHDPLLVQVVEELGDDASGTYARLRIEDVPSGMQYRIDEYDGSERVMTREDYEWKTAL
ncbi:MAG: hypothetical protein AB7U75_14585 [Hyphomicrobiaceae bacterium]